MADYRYIIKKCHRVSRDTNARPLVACYPLELVRLPEQERDARTLKIGSMSIFIKNVKPDL